MRVEQIERGFSVDSFNNVPTLAFQFHRDVISQGPGSTKDMGIGVATLGLTSNNA